MPLHYNRTILFIPYYIYAYSCMVSIGNKNPYVRGSLSVKRVSEQNLRHNNCPKHWMVSGVLCYTNNYNNTTEWYCELDVTWKSWYYTTTPKTRTLFPLDILQMWRLCYKRHVYRQPLVANVQKIIYKKIYKCKKI